MQRNSCEIEIPADDEIALFDNKLSPYTFMMNRIKNLDLTPAQLALDPCTGSCVITDVKTGEIKKRECLPKVFVWI